MGFTKDEVKVPHAGSEPHEKGATEMERKVLHLAVHVFTR